MQERSTPCHSAGRLRCGEWGAYYSNYGKFQTGGNKMKALILLSGGIDSMACVNFYKTLGYTVECLFCNYGQPAAAIEMKSSQKVASHFLVPYTTIEIKNISIPKCGEICGRNALLTWAAFCKIGFGAYKIVLGIHDGTNYSDCTPKFVDAVNRVLDVYTGGTVILESPFMLWKKNEIVEYCKENSLPLNYTYSCETGAYPPCGHCPSCLDRKELLYE